MKRVTRILVAAVLLVSMLTVSAFAAGGTTITGTSVKANKGDTKTVEFALAGNPGVAAISATIEADPGLEIVKIEKADLDVKAGMRDGKGRISFAQSENFKGDATLCKVTVKVLADAEGTYPVKLILDNFTNQDQEQLKGSVSVTDAKVVIAHEHAWGDWTANGADGHVRDCACGEKESKAHEYGEWTVTKAATETEEGLKVRTCSVCGYEDQATIPVVTPGEDPTEPEDPADPTDKEDPKEEPKDEESAKTGDNFSIVLFGTVALAALAAAAGTVFVRRRNN